MSRVVDFNLVKNKKENLRKEAKLSKLKASFRASREDSMSKPKSAEKLKSLFSSNKGKKK